MLFPTLDFAIFFIIVFLASWSLVGHLQGRKTFLLVASYFFYGYWDWRFMLLLAGSSLINYWGGRVLSIERWPHKRKFIVGITIALNLSILGFFKYYGFFIESMNEILFSLGLEREIPIFEIILPVGISFFTFQGISYVIDVYREDIKPIRDPVDVFLYISFFPQLVAGPIVRAAHFLPQLDKEPILNKQMAAFGITLILFGLFKKMVVAHYMAELIVDEIFADAWSFGAVDLLVGVYAYAVQIYCDFSGYSDIAIGTAALLGFKFNANFNQPYRATSMRDFWHRWHISLSTWLRDYLYKPLGGSRGSTVKTMRNLMITMLLGGLWHGAAVTFILWGLFHGALLALERMLDRLRFTSPETEPTHAGSGFIAWTVNAGDKSNKIISRIVSTALTFHLVCFGWILFRAEDLEMVKAILTGLGNWDEEILLATPFVCALVFLSLLMHFVPADLPQRFSRLFTNSGPIIVGLTMGLGVILVSAVAPEGVAPFIYFQF